MVDAFWVQALGWVGSALLVVSLLQASVLRLRVLNLVACVMLTWFNAVLHVWPMAAMNLALTVINLWFIARLWRERGEHTSYSALRVPLDDGYLFHFLSVHEADIATFFPHFPTPDASSRQVHGRRAFLIQRGDETVGVIIARNVGRGVAQLELDYVTPRFRDLGPGEWAFRRSTLFPEQGFRTVRSPEGAVGVRHYQRLGFTRRGDAWELGV